jgi:hypothetical protein
MLPVFARPRAGRRRRCDLEVPTRVRAANCSREARPKQCLIPVLVVQSSLSDLARGLVIDPEASVLDGPPPRQATLLSPTDAVKREAR